MSFFSDIIDTIGDFVGGLTGSGSSSPQQPSGPAPGGGVIAGQAGQQQGGGFNYGGLIGDIIKIGAPFITANVVKPNKPSFPTVPDSVKNDPRVQNLIGPYGGYTNAPYTKSLSPFQIAFGTTLQNLLYDPASQQQGPADGTDITGRKEPTGNEPPAGAQSGNVQSDILTPGFGDLTDQGGITERDITPPAQWNFSEKTVQNVERFGTLISDAAAKANLDPAILKAVVSAESRGEPDAKSPKGAIGLGQLMLSTGQSLAKAPLTAEQIANPATNLALSAQFLSQLVKKYDGDFEKVFGAYNAGEGAVNSGKYKKFKETRDYIPRVAGWYKYYKNAKQSG